MTFLINVFGLEVFGPVFATVVICAVLSFIFFILHFFFKKIDPNKKTPLWVVPFLWLVDLMNNFIKDNIGVRWKSLAPWFLTIVIYLFFANTSAVYLLDNPTSYLVITAALAFTSFVVIQTTGLRSLGFKGYLKSFLDPTPIMLPMNIISEITLPVSLALRMYGNIISGTAISLLLKYSFEWFAVPIMPFINALFDIAFGLIQVVVFVLLSVIFTSMKVKDEEKIY